MGTRSLNFAFYTNDQGKFSERRQFDTATHWPWWLPNMNVAVDLYAELLSPEDTTVRGTLDVDGANGPYNAERKFTLKTGEREFLGEWDVDKGTQIIKVSGSTDPIVAGGRLKVRVTVDD